MNGPAKNSLTVVTVCVILLLGASPSAAGEEAPKISSSLARSLWRQCHMYYEEGMDAKAKRACGELQAWARENNESEIAQETDGMLATLNARRQPDANAAAAQPKQAKPGLRTDLQECGYDSVYDIPPHVVTKIIGNTPEEFLTCTQDKDCVAAQSFCGTKKAVNKRSQQCYEAVARFFDTSARCAQTEPFPATAVCRKQTCMIQF